MTTYVLVGGAWLGGWCWRPVARRLRDNGHDVYPVTLTGLGERVHLASPEVDLDTHITDVVNVIEFEDLRDVVLLGHSYGGLVVMGAADRVPERISRLVYLDTAPLPDGGMLIEKFPPELRKRTEEQVQELGQGWRFPMPPTEELDNMASLEGLDEDDMRLLRSRATPQPFGTYTQRLRLKNPAREALPKLGILCSFSLAQVREMIAGGTPCSAGSRAPSGGSSSCPRVTGRCSPGPRISQGCSSISHPGSPFETTLADLGGLPEGHRRSPGGKEGEKKAAPRSEDRGLPVGTPGAAPAGGRQIIVVPHRE